MQQGGGGPAYSGDSGSRSAFRRSFSSSFLAFLLAFLRAICSLSSSVYSGKQPR